MLIVGLMSLALLCNIVAFVGSYKVHKQNCKIVALWSAYDAMTTEKLDGLKELAFLYVEKIKWLEARAKEDF